MVDKILVLDIQVDTQSPDFYNSKYGDEYNIDRRFDILREALMQTKHRLNTSYSDTGHQKIRAIITAPEYFFAKNTEKTTHGELNASRQYPEQGAIYIQKQLTLLSRKYPKILIIPGTVAWQQHAIAPLEPQVDYGAHAPVPTMGGRNKHAYTVMEEIRSDARERGIVLTGAACLAEYQKSADSLWLEAAEQIRKELKPVTGSRPDGLAPSNTREAKLNLLRQADRYNEYFQYIYNITACGNILISRNTAYFYLNGTQAYAYHKCSDFQEILSYDNNVYLPGTNKPFVNIGGIDFGIEICLDHCYGILKKFEVNVDIHLVLSAFVKNSTTNRCVKPGGYLVHASSHSACRTVRRNEGASQIEACLYSYIVPLTVKHPTTSSVSPSLPDDTPTFSTSSRMNSIRDSGTTHHVSSAPHSSRGIPDSISSRPVGHRADISRAAAPPPKKPVRTEMSSSGTSYGALYTHSPKDTYKKSGEDKDKRPRPR